MLGWAFGLSSAAVSTRTAEGDTYEKAVKRPPPAIQNVPVSVS